MKRQPFSIYHEKFALGWRWIRVRSSMMVASVVVLARVMIGVMPMGVVPRRLRMGSIGHG